MTRTGLDKPPPSAPIIPRFFHRKNCRRQNQRQFPAVSLNQLFLRPVFPPSLPHLPFFHNCYKMITSSTGRRDGLNQNKKPEFSQKGTIDL